MDTERSESPQLWRWVNWDMDRSFRHSSKFSIGPTWDKMALDLILKDALDEDATPEQVETNAIQTSDVRGLIFAGLLRDDPTFQKWFTKRATEFMNHAINERFLTKRIAWYAQFRGMPGISPKALAVTKEFLDERSDFFREDLARVFQMEECFPVDFTSPQDDIYAGAPLFIVDGWPEPSPYRGYYFKGQTIRIELPEFENSHPRTWFLDDLPVEAQTLELELTGPLQITYR